MSFDIEEFLRVLREKDALREKDDVQCEEVARIEPKYFDGDLSDLGLSSKVADAVRKELGGKQLYQHQADAIKSSVNGGNIVLESPTASGKTLSFAAPMLESVCGGGTALMVYPMKAVAYDQRRQIKTLCRSVDVESWTYDGDTPDEEKKAIRDNHPRTQILLTNPDFLHLSFLGSSKTHQSFLERLSFIVLDEAHEYRGHFGCNIALLLRRFLVKVERLGARPTIFMATATCKNPLEHAEILTGRKFTRVSAANAMRPKRHYIFADTDIPDFKFRDVFRLRIANAAVACLRMGLSALVFCPSKNFIGAAVKDAKKAARKNELNEREIAEFTANLTVERKQEVQEGIKNGSIKVVFCTNALEVGIDIGFLDGVILAGFPDNIAAARQRIGRAGRSWNSDAFVLYYPENNPLDRFYAANLPTFLNSPLLPVAADSENEEAIDKHVPFLLHEMEYQPDDFLEEYLGKKFYDAFRQKAGRGEPVAGYAPYYMSLPLRGGIGGSYQLKTAAGKEIGAVPESQKFKELYLGAVFLHDGEVYRVNSHEADSVVLGNETRNVRTEPYFYSVVHHDGTMFDGVQYKKEGFVLEVAFLKLSIFENMNSYRLIDNATGDDLERHSLNDTRSHNNRHAVAVIVKGAGEIAVRSLEQIMRIGALFVVPADRHDTSTHFGEGKLYLYENYPGGIGVARKIFSDWRNVMKEGADIAQKCKCAKGCPNCVMPPRATDEIDKRAGIDLAEEILDAVASSDVEQYRIQDGQWVKNNAE